MLDIQSLQGRGLGNVLRNSASGVALAIALGIPVSGYAAALPSHGHFVSGQGSINKASQSLTVKQSSTTGIIDWNSFSVGKHSGVTFDNGSGATLNRVTGGNLSTIAGSLHATGSLFLMNSAGVIVSGTGKVVTGGNFVVSSGAIGGAFGDSRLKEGVATVVNKGSIVAGGAATLNGGDVRDTGSIRASQVNLQAADRLQVNGAVTARNADGTGGTIVATGRRIALGSKADLSASGTRGGTVLIGGDIHGGAFAADNFVHQGVRNAENTSIAAGAQISADGSKTSGGNIVIWSDGHTTFAGQVSAKGQTAGGFAEISSHKLLGFTGRVDLTSARGTTGTLLLDPENVTIEDGTTTTESSSGGDPNTYTPSGDDSVISVSDLEDALSSANVIVTTGGSGSTGSQAGDITVLSPVTWSSGSTLTLDANRNIAIDAAISITGAGGLTLIDADTSGTGVNDGVAADGSYSFNGGSVAFTNVTSGDTTALTINGQAYTLENNVADLAAAISTNGGAGFYALADNYDASGDNGGSPYTASPIASVANPFTGVFEGLGNTISNLTIAVTAQQTSVGLFASSSGTLRDIGLVNANVSDTSADNVGALAGASSGTILNSYSSGVVTSGGVAGGLVGQSSAGRISQSFSMSAVSGDGEVGGLIGYVTGGSVSQSYATGAVTGTSDTGGLIGENNGGSIDSSYATGSVSSTGSAEAYVGGLVGFNGSGTITASQATGSVAGTGGMLGGFAGKNAGTIAQSWATGAVTATGDETVGGFVGGNHGTISQSWASGAARTGANGLLGGFAGKNGGAIEQSYSASALTGGTGSTIGGFVGANGFVGFNGSDVEYDGTITQSYSTGSVAGGTGSTIGGFAGTNGYSGNSGVSTIDESYSSGAVTGMSSVAGGFAGANFGTLGGTTENFYNTTKNPSLSAVGNDSGAVATSHDGGLTSTQMMTASSFTGWTFGTTGGASGWVIVDQDGSLNNASDAAGGTTPMLLTEYSTTITSAHQLQLMELDPTANYTAGADINASGTAGGDVWGTSGFIPIGVQEVSDYTGAFEGANHTISNLYENAGSTGYFGLFTGVDGSVADIGLVNANMIVGTGSTLGALAGYNNGTITNSYSTGTLHGGATSDVGGLAGHSGGSISDSYSTASVVSASGGHDGGLVGWSTGGTISQSYATGNVNGGDNSSAGGLVGESDSSTITGSSAAGKVTVGAESDAGGFVGVLVSNSVVNTSYATGNVSSGDNSFAGGFVSEVGNGSTISTSYATGSVTGGNANDIGGFVAFNNGAISKAYATGDVTDGNAATGVVGGFVGDNLSGGTINEAYSLGAASGGSGVTVGGFDGKNSGGSIGGSTAVYYNSDANPEGDTGITNGGGLSLADMRDPSKYSGWNFGDLGSGSDWVTIGSDSSVNGTGGTTPMLLSEYSTTLTNAHQLQLMALDGTATYTVGRDFDASGTAGGDVWNSTGFIPVSYFIGTLDGAGHAISNLTINNTYYAGLFYEMGDGTVIENIGLTNVNISGSGDVGGFAGDGYGFVISNSYVTGTLSSTSGAVGGLVGYSDLSSTISSSHAEVTITKGHDVGGLVGYSGASISNSYATGSIKGGATVGGLVGTNDGGTITQSYSSATVQVSSDEYAGGLVGENYGLISQSFATGSVTGPASSALGGFVGYNDGGISQSYATGAVQGGQESEVGGFVGSNDGSIDQSYSLGAVTAPDAYVIGGFAGYDDSENGITNSYWNTNTSGLSTDGYSYSGTGAAGRTTQQLQSGLQTGFDNTVWSIVAGTSFPYLDWQFPNGAPQVVSGKVLNEVGGAPVSGAILTALDNGTVLPSALGTVTSYADGYYYYLVAPNTLGAGSNVIVYSSGRAGAAFEDGVSGSVGNLDFYGGYVHEVTSDTAYSSVVSNLAVAIGSNSAVQAQVSAASGLVIDALSNFNIDSAISLGSGTLVINSAAGDSINQTASITAANLLLTGDSDFTLDNPANNISKVAMSGSGSIDLTDDHALTISTVAGVNGVDAGGGVGITTTAGGITISQQLIAQDHPLTLVSAGTIAESGSGLIEAASLTGSSASTVTLNSATNAIADLNAFVSGGNFSLTDGRDLSVAGALNAGTHTILLATDTAHNLAIDAALQGGTVTLHSGRITESSAGQIVANKLEGSSSGTAEMNSATNTITDLGAFTSGGIFELTDDHNLTLDGTLNAGTHAVDLTTTGSGHAIAIDAKLEGGTVKLTSAATISESNAGDLDANKLTGYSVGSAELTSVKNTIAELGAFTSGGTFELTDGHNLTLDGTLNAGTHTVDLTTTGAGHGIAVHAELEGGTVKLTSAGTISENSSGDLDATKLTGSSVGSAELTSAKNTITDLGGFTSGSIFELTDDHNLTLDGTLNAGTHTVDLTTTGSGHDIAIDAKLEGGTVKLISAGTITESKAGDLDATKLTGSSVGNAEMNNAKNTITDLGAFSTAGNKAFELTDDHALTVDGTVTTGTGLLDLTTIGTGHNLAIDSAIAGGTVRLVTTGKATESSAGAITASLLNVTAGTGIELTSTKNKIKKLGTDKTKTGPNKVTL